MPNQQLMDFILASRATGQTDEQIKNTLRQNGWQDASFAGAFGPQPLQTVMPQPTQSIPASSPTVEDDPSVVVTEFKKPPFKKIFLLAFVILVLGGAAVAAYGYLSMGPAQSPSLPPALPASEPAVGAVVATSTPTPSSVDQLLKAKAACSMLLANNAKLISGTIHAGDTDATTGGEVSVLQKWLAIDAKDFPNFQVTGVFDAATQQAVVKMEEQSNSSKTPITDTNTGKSIPLDAPGTFGAYGRASIITPCSLLLALSQMSQNIDQQINATPTTQDFPIPWYVSIHPGDTAVSADKKYSITLNGVTDVPAAFDVTITANGQSKRVTISNPGAATVNGLTVTFKGAVGGGTTEIATFKVSGPSSVPPPNVAFNIPGSVTLLPNQKATGSYGGQSIQVVHDVPGGGTLDIGNTTIMLSPDPKTNVPGMVMGSTTDSGVHVSFVINKDNSATFMFSAAQ